MTPIRLFSAAEQVAAHLQEAMLRGDLSGELPGIHQLAANLNVNHKTVAAALRRLEKVGLLVAQGAGRKRKITIPNSPASPSLKVAILLYEPYNAELIYLVQLTHLLIEAGHTPVFPDKTLTELGMEVNRVARLVNRTEVDAWIVVAGSTEVLEWFAGEAVPTFALFGSRQNVPIAGTGPQKSTAIVAVVRRLVELGHHRLVLLTREEYRKPQAKLREHVFLDELEAQGIHTGPFNLPDWQENLKGFHQCLASLFKHTPPTGLLIDTAPLFIAAQQHLAQRGIVAPQHVSLVCLDPDPTFVWCEPKIAHIRWDPSPMVRHIVRWVNNVSRGKDDRRQTFTKAEFIEGGTIGPMSEAR